MKIGIETFFELQESAQHKMYVRSPKDQLGDTFGQLILVNGINQHEYMFDVMKDEEINLDERELYNSIFLSNVVGNLALDDKGEVLEMLEAAREQTTLQHFLSENEFEKVFRKIVNSDLNKKPFVHEIPVTEQRMNLSYLLMDEEINRMIYLILDGNLTKKEIVDVGKLIVLRNIPVEQLHFGRLSYFEGPFKNVLKSRDVTILEQKFINVARVAFKI